MEGAVIIRSATAADAEAIFAVTRDSAAGLAAGHYSSQQITGWMGDRTPDTYREGAASGRIKVAEADGKVVGYVDAIPGEVTRLFLLPEVARQGLGRRLMELGLEMARQGHDGPLHVEATRNAEAFYAHFGFRRVGTSFFAGRGDDGPPIETVLMEREG
jgi:predicted N-acetyltransferase YhbS